MSPATPSSDPRPGEPTAGDLADRDRVARILRRIRAAVRQRQAVEATLDGGSPGAGARRDELRRHEAIREPHPFSHRRGLGRLIVLVRRAVYQLFLRWAVRPILEQQNAFNAAASRAVQDLLAENDRLRQRVRALEARWEGLDAEAAADAGDRAGGPADRRD